MSPVKISAALLAAVLLGTTSVAQTQQARWRPESDEFPVLMEQTPSPAPAPAPDRRPLMQLLSYPGIAQQLEKMNINIYGHVQSSFTHNFDDPHSDMNFGRVFDFVDDRVMFNQFDIAVERTIDAGKKQWDVGGKMEWIWGEDAGLIHSNGLFDWYKLQRAKGDSRNSPEEQWDLNQLYVDLAIPVGNGLRVRAGKFVTLLGWETINPTTNPFLSHSYLFGFAIPFTHTGVMATYQINDNWSVEGGFFLGWEQSLNDNNDSLSYHLKGAYTSKDKKLNVIGQFVTGPEEPDNNRDWRTVFDFIVSYQFTDKFQLGANADFGWEQNVAPGNEDALWYGIASYAQYKLSDYITFNGRAEWFRDEEGMRIGVAGNYYEVTLGATVHPVPHDRWGKNLFFRPEIRGDWASHGVFNDGSDSSMYTFGVDVIYTF